MLVNTKYDTLLKEVLSQMCIHNSIVGQIITLFSNFIYEKPGYALAGYLVFYLLSESAHLTIIDLLHVYVPVRPRVCC